MKGGLADGSLDHLRRLFAEPDLQGTRFELLEVADRGGMATIYRAREPALGREVALKVPTDPDPTAGEAARLEREARILARLEHPGIVPVHDVGRLADGRPYYAMRWVEGERLDHYLHPEKSAARDAAPSLEDRLRIFQRLAETVSYAHAHAVVHRDLKPQNVMVGPFGEVLVMDWGVAKWSGTEETGEAEPDGSRQAEASSAASPGATRAGTVLGTPGYMAPEQASGRAAEADPRADVYSLGALLVYLLTGAPPEPDSGAPAAIPRPLAAVCKKALALEPGERYDAVDEMAADVRRFTRGAAVGAHRERLTDKLARFYRRYQAAILLILAYLLMRAILLWWLRV